MPHQEAAHTTVPDLTATDFGTTSGLPTRGASTYVGWLRTGNGREPAPQRPGSAAKSRDEQGHLFLDSNPLKGLKTPKEKNPKRVLLTEPEYQALLQVSLEVDWRFRVALVLAHETGHRIGAIRQLRWTDIDIEGGVVRWRAEHEKSGYEHLTPVTAEALAVLELARRRNPGIGDTPVLPTPKDPSTCVSHSMARRWWKKAQEFAGLEPKRGRGWNPSVGAAGTQAESRDQSSQVSMGQRLAAPCGRRVSLSVC